MCGVSQSNFKKGNPLEQALQCPRQNCRKCKRPPNGKGFALKHCPLRENHRHGDRNPSLSVLYKDDQIVAVRCFAGCDRDEVRKALGLEKKCRKKFTTEIAQQSVPTDPVSWIAFYCDLDPAWVAREAIEYGLQLIEDENVPAVAFTWHGVDARKIRRWPKNFRWEGSLRPAVWPHPEVIRARFPDHDWLVITEGEFDTLILLYMGVPAISTTKGANSSVSGLGLELKRLGFNRTLIVPDNDDAGRRFAKQAAKALQGENLKVVVGDVCQLGLGSAITGENDLRDVWIGRTDVDEDDIHLACISALNESEESAEDVEVVDLADLLKQPSTPIQWLFKDLLPLGGCYLLFGRAKSGKSFLTLDLLESFLTGSAALGVFPKKANGRMLMLPLEDGTERFKRRVHARNLNVESGKVLVRFVPPQDILHFIETTVHRFPDIKCIVIDTLPALMREVKSLRDVFQQDYDRLKGLNDMAQRLSITILIIAHKRKSSAADPADEIAGSGGLLAAVDGILILDRKRGEDFAVLHRYIRDAKDAKFGLLFRSLKWRCIGDDEVVKSEYTKDKVVRILIREAPDALTPDNIFKELRNEGVKISERQLYRVLKDLVDEGRIERPKKGLYRIKIEIPGPGGDDDDNDGGGDGSGGTHENPENDGQDVSFVHRDHISSYVDKDLRSDVETDITPPKKVTSALTSENREMSVSEFCLRGWETPGNSKLTSPQKASTDAEQRGSVTANSRISTEKVGESDISQNSMSPSTSVRMSVRMSVRNSSSGKEKTVVTDILTSNDGDDDPEYDRNRKGGRIIRFRNNATIGPDGEVVPIDPPDDLSDQARSDPDVQPEPPDPEPTEPRSESCPRCGSVNTRKFGRSRGKQRYQCRDCKRTWTSTRTDQHGSTHADQHTCVDPPNDQHAGINTNDQHTGINTDQHKVDQHDDGLCDNLKRSTPDGRCPECGHLVESFFGTSMVVCRNCGWVGVANKKP